MTDRRSPLPFLAALARFIESGGFARRRMRSIYEQRPRLILYFLERDFDGLLQPLPSSGGLHVAAEAPGLSEAEVESALRRASEGAR